MAFPFSGFVQESGSDVPAWLAWSWAAYPITTRRVRDGLRSIMVYTSGGLLETHPSRMRLMLHHTLPQQRLNCKGLTCMINAPVADASLLVAVRRCSGFDGAPVRCGIGRYAAQFDVAAQVSATPL